MERAHRVVARRGLRSVDGGFLVCVCASKTIKQVYEYPTGVNTVHRTLDGSLMVLRAYWEGKDGQVCTIRRVFRRVQ